LRLRLPEGGEVLIDDLLDRAGLDGLVVCGFDPGLDGAVERLFGLLGLDRRDRGQAGCGADCEYDQCQFVQEQLGSAHSILQLAAIVAADHSAAKPAKAARHEKPQALLMTAQMASSSSSLT
jgi:hypothetical protein